MYVLRPAVCLSRKAGKNERGTVIVCRGVNHWAVGLF
jgi:mRNA-degrading endonuclease toxin of MazEF toxin-antitoxin module